MIQRVVYLSNARLPTEKAHGYQIMKMCEAFAETGLDVVLYHANRIQTDDRCKVSPFVYYDVQEIYQLRQLHGLDPRDLLYKRHPQIWFRIQSVSNAFSAWIESRKYWSSENTVIFSRDFIATLLLCLSRHTIKAKLIHDMHGSITKKKSMVGPLLNRLDGFVAINRTMGKDVALAKVDTEKIFIAPNGADLDKYNLRENKEACCNKLGVSCDRPVVGYLGRFQTMGEEKGIPDLIEALGHVNASGVVDARLLCIGGPLDHLDAYSSIAEKAGVRPEQIRFVDRVPNAEVPYWINTFSIAVLPFPYTEHYAFYMSPLKMFEYMASGKPILATDLPSIREVLVHDHNAWLVEPDNPPALAAGIEKLLKEPDLAARIAAQAREDVEQYTWRARAGRIIDFIEHQEEKDNIGTR